jgi:hypothetical protein
MKGITRTVEMCEVTDEVVVQRVKVVTVPDAVQAFRYRMAIFECTKASGAHTKENVKRHTILDNYFECCG